MAANIGDLLTNLSATLGRGTALDSELLVRIRNSVRQIERAGNYRWMWRFDDSVSFTTATRRLALSSLLTATNRQLKRVEFLRIVDSTSEFIYLDQVDPADLSARTTSYSTATTGTPTSFWIDGELDLVLNVQTASAETAEIGLYQFTNLGTVTGTATHWLFENGEDAIEAQIMYNIAARIRDDKAMARWRALRDEILSDVVVSEEELIRGGSANLQMRLPY